MVGNSPWARGGLRPMTLVAAPAGACRKRPASRRRLPLAMVGFCMASGRAYQIGHAYGRAGHRRPHPRRRCRRPPGREGRVDHPRGRPQAQREGPAHRQGARRGHGRRARPHEGALLLRAPDAASRPEHPAHGRVPSRHRRRRDGAAADGQQRLPRAGARQDHRHDRRGHHPGGRRLARLDRALLLRGPAPHPRQARRGQRAHQPQHGPHGRLARLRVHALRHRLAPAVQLRPPRGPDRALHVPQPVARERVQPPGGPARARHRGPRQERHPRPSRTS